MLVATGFYRPGADTSTMTRSCAKCGASVIDRYIEEIQKMRNDGAIVIIKWDGERTELRQTVIVNRPDTDYVWRKDCDNLASALHEAILDYKNTHTR
jgi:hypothetical protein